MKRRFSSNFMLILIALTQAAITWLYAKGHRS